MARYDLGDYLEDDALVVPVPQPDGTVKDYVIPSPNKDDGLWLAALGHLGFKASSGRKLTKADADQLTLDDDEERELYQVVLGPVYDELLADEVSWVRIQRLGKWAFFAFAFSPEQAEEARRNGALSGEGSRPNRAQRRHPAAPATRKAATKKASTASASTTRRRGSTGSSGTPARKRAASR